MTFARGLWDDPPVRRNSAIAIVEKLQKAGYQAVFAGGCVRDALLGLEPADYDIATSATPDEVEALFDKTIPIGRAFGILLVPDGDHYFEVATFRHDESYLDGRRPTAVRFVDMESDARRRDFTINAMFEDPITGVIHDFVGGQEDLKTGIVRAVGNASERFAEDRLRLLRAVRFSARFNFPIEFGTLTAMLPVAASITQVSAERIGEELVRMLTEGAARRAFELLDVTGLLAQVMPEIAVMKGCEQPPEFHPEGDVFEHTLLCLEHLQAGCTETLALGVLLHDVAKPFCAATTAEGKKTFYGHTKEGARMAEQICRRLRRSNATTERVSFLVDQHLRHCSAAQMRRANLTRFLRQDGIDELLELARIDALSANGDLGHYEFCTNALSQLPSDVLRPPPLVSGEDLKKLGMTPGPMFRTILAAVEDAQLDGALADRDAALAFVRERFLR